MPLSFLPTLIFDQLTDITPEDLLSRGIRLLMMDFDNTIIPYTSTIPGDKLLRWLTAMQESPVCLCVVSNSKKDKPGAFCRQYGVDYITHAGKPSTKGIRRCLAMYDLSPKQAALVGDQIYTDVLGGNRAGVTSILITPLHLHNIWLKLRHWVEMPFILMARRRKVQPRR